MSEQDDLFNKEAEQKSAAVDSPEPSAVSFAEEEALTLESGDIAGGGIASGEVRAVESPPQHGASQRLWLVMLVLVALFGVGYYLLSGGVSQQAQLESGVQRQSAPQRYAIDKQVKVEVVEQKKVASTEPMDESGLEKEPLAARQAAPTAEANKPRAGSVVASVAPVAAVKTDPLYRVLVGPYLSTSVMRKAAAQLEELGFETQPTKGRGMVTMTRLLAGVYPAGEAKARLGKLKTRVGDAFMLPLGDQQAIYVGSFSDPERASKYIEKLTKKGVNVTAVLSDVEMSGKMLIAIQADQQTAQQAAALISKSGLKTQVVRK